MPQIQEQQQVNITINDLIYAQVKDLGNRMDRLEKGFESTRTELNARMDRLERRQDKLEEKLERTRQELSDTRRELNARLDKQDDKIEKLADKIDRLANKIDASSSHGQIATISSVGVGLSGLSIVLAVIYS